MEGIVLGFLNLIDHFPHARFQSLALLHDMFALASVIRLGKGQEKSA